MSTLQNLVERLSIRVEAVKEIKGGNLIFMLMVLKCTVHKVRRSGVPKKFVHMVYISGLQTAARGLDVAICLF